jgi:hypothetical protein
LRECAARGGRFGAAAVPGFAPLNPGYANAGDVNPGDVNPGDINPRDVNPSHLGRRARMMPVMGHGHAGS